MKIDYELGALAAQQAGYLGRKQVMAQGVSEAAIRWRLDSGTWVLVRNGLYKVVGVDGDYQGRLRGAMATLPDPTISHESAAEIHEIPYVARGKAIVTVHAGTTHGFPRRNGSSEHRSSPSPSPQIAGQYATTPERTLIDVAAKIRLGALGLALDESLASGMVSITELQKLFEEVARRGRTGSGPMRKLLDERLGSDIVRASRLERVGMSVFSEAGCHLHSGNTPRLGTQRSESILPGRMFASVVSVTVGVGIAASQTFRRTESATTSRSPITGGSSGLHGKTSPSDRM